MNKHCRNDHYHNNDKNEMFVIWNWKFCFFFVQQRNLFVVVIYRSKLESKLRKIYRSKLNRWHFDWRDFLIIIEQTLYSTCWWNEFKLNVELIRNRNIELKCVELKTKFFDKIVDFFDDDLVSFYSFAEIVYSVVVFSNRNNQSKLSV